MTKPKIIYPIFFVTALIFSAPLALAWNNPTAAPTGGTGAIGVVSGAAANTLYISSGGNIGIGITSPSAKLDISLSAPTAGSYVRAGAGSYGVLEVGVPNTADNKSFISLHKSGTIMYQVGVSGSDMVFAKGGGAVTDTLQTEVVRFAANGNVGIGRPSPTTALDVNGTVTASSFTGPVTGTVSAANVSSGSFGSLSSGGVYGFPDKLSVGYGLGSTPTTQSQTGTGSLSVFGYAGIGTTNPLGRLHINSIRPIIMDNNGGSGIYGEHIGFNVTLNTSVVPNTITKLGGTSQQSGAIITTDYLGTMAFQMYNAGTELASTVNYAPQVVFNSSGNVGIGTTAPATALDVQKPITASAGVANGVNLQQTLTAAANGDTLSALNINPTFVVGAYTPVNRYAINANGTIKATGFEGPLSGIVNAANVSSGTFGTNTGGGNYSFPATITAATASLTSNGGALKLFGSGDALTHVYTEYYPGGAAAGRYGWEGYGSSGTQDFSIVNQRAVGSLYLGTNGTYQATITGAGNVGIGTTSPTGKLHVVGGGGPVTTGAGVVIDGSDTAGNARVELRTSAGTPYIDFANDLTSDYNARIRLVSAGNLAIESANVGIGTTTPAYKLEVASGTNNPFYLNGTYNKIQANAGFTEIESFHNTRLVIDSTNSYTDRFFSVSKGASYIGGGVPTELFRITEAGRVGIGTTTPASALDVGTGGITLNGVTRTTWPGGIDVPVFTNLIYGSTGDLPFRTTGTTPQSMRYVYGPFGYAMPTCPSGYTRQYRLYGEEVDSITNGGQLAYVRIAFDGGVNIDFNLGSTWGGSPSYKTYLSGLFSTTNTNHATIQAWINGVAGPYLEIRRLEIRMYCI